MASDVKWIKIKVGLFDGTSFKRIKKAKIGGESFRDKLTAIWFELLDLGAKCNNDGFLYSDEIPYGSEEDIAIMIDREIDEVKLCLEFYKNNGMIEIINDVYCLSNWNKYQNVDGLDKIREQNRIRQKRWYDNQKLIENKNPNVRLTLNPNESALISKSNSISNINNNIIDKENIIKEIFDFWNEQNIIIHRELSSELKKVINNTLKKYDVEEIKKCILRYGDMYHSEYEYCKYKWSLEKFLKQSNGLKDFTDEGTKWNNYLQWKNNNKMSNKNNSMYKDGILQVGIDNSDSDDVF